MEKVPVIYSSSDLPTEVVRALPSAVPSAVIHPGGTIMVTVQDPVLKVDRVRGVFIHRVRWNVGKGHIELLVGIIPADDEAKTWKST